MYKRADVSLPLDIVEQPEAIVGEKVGYARVSSKDQNLERQTELLRKERIFSLYEDRMTGSTRHRPRLEEALRYVRKGDQLIVSSTDRLALSLTCIPLLVTSPHAVSR